MRHTFWLEFVQEPLYVWTRHAAESIEAQTGVFYDDWTFDVFRRLPAFRLTNLPWLPLVLGKVDLLGRQLSTWTTGF